MPSSASITGSISFGSANYSKNIPKNEPPKPNPEMITPLTKPLLSGKWLSPALSVAADINPLKIPFPSVYTKMNICG